MSRQEYSTETKAQVMAALLTGQSVSSVSKEYKIPRGTVANWSADREDKLKQTDPNTKKQIGDMLVKYLQGSLIALARQTEVFGNEEWLKKQPASELAVLHGVIADKSIRLLEALADKEQFDQDNI